MTEPNTTFQCPHCEGDIEIRGLTGSNSCVRAEVAEQHEGGRNMTLLITQFRMHIEGTVSTAWLNTASSHLRAFRDGGGLLTRKEVAVFIDRLRVEGLAIKTINDYLGTLSSFCKWLVNRGELQENPVTGQFLKAPRGLAKASEEKLAFESDEVAYLLRYVHQTARRTTAGFVTTMAYTGARNEEVAQLRFKDVTTVDGTPVFDFVVVESGLRRKSLAALRFVPLHPRLLNMEDEFRLVCVPSNGRMAEANLWDFQKVCGRYSYTASRWVNEKALPVLKRRGMIRDDPRLTLYSLRHSVITQLKHKGVDEAMIAQLVGHSNPNITTGRYGKDYPVGPLKEAVDLLEW